MARPWNRVPQRRTRPSVHRSRRLMLERLESRRMLSATNILTYLNDLSGTGANTSETTLTPANVNTSNFGKLFSSSVDGQVYAQPLYMASVNITTGANQGIHNVVFVATAHDSLYAFDADNGAKLWQTSFLSATVSGVLNVNPNIAANVTITTVPSGDVSSTDISPEIGVIATPVIDPTSGTIYLTAKTKEIINGNTSAPDYFYQLYAINLQNGHLQTGLGGGVVKIGDTVFSGGVYTNTTSISVAGTGAGNVGGVVKFNALRQLNRPGLTLYYDSNNVGHIYIAFASHGDNGPYHGWVLGYNPSNLQLTGVFNANPNGSDDGVWQSGGRVEVDSSGALYFETGNGTFETSLNAQGFPSNGDYGDSVLKIVTDSSTSSTPNINGWGFHVADYFTPFNQATLNSGDTDLGASGLVILPDSVGSAAHPHLLIARGKAGVIYLIDRDSMGKFNPNTDQVVQKFTDSAGFWSSPTYAVIGSTAYFYGTPSGGTLHQWSISNGAFSTSVLHAGPDAYAFPGATGFISANGTANGIVWEVEKNTNQLRAYRADNVSTELYTSAQAANNRDALGTVVKFSVPIVDNGHVYVGTGSSLVVYGELPFIITTTNDSGAGSLRQALLDAGQLPGQTHTLQFALPTGPQSINLLSALPSVSDPTVLSLDATQNVTLVLSSGTTWNNNATMTLAGAGMLSIRGGIEGAGNLTITAGSNLTAGHLIQNALVIGGTAGSFGTMTIGASDASGNPLTMVNSVTAASTTSAATAAPTSATAAGSSPLPRAVAASARASSQIVGEMALDDSTSNEHKWSTMLTGSVVSSNSEIANMPERPAAIAASRNDGFPHRDALAALDSLADVTSAATVPVSLSSPSDADLSYMPDDLVAAIGRRWRI